MKNPLTAALNREKWGSPWCSKDNFQEHCQINLPQLKRLQYRYLLLSFPCFLSLTVKSFYLFVFNFFSCFVLVHLFSANVPASYSFLCCFQINVLQSKKRSEILKSVSLPSAHIKK